MSFKNHLLRFTFALAILFTNLAGSAIPSGLSKSKPSKQAIQESVNFKIDPESLTSLIASRIEFPEGSRIISFDMDETLISYNKLSNSGKEKARMLGYKFQVSDKKKKEFILRPGAIELMQYLRDNGFKIVVSSRNLRSNVEDIVESSDLRYYVDHYTGLEDLVDDPNNQNFKLMPRHPNNLPFIEKLIGFLHTWLIRFPEKFIWRSVLSMFNENINPYIPSYPWEINKYTPYLSGSRVLIDNLYEENKRNALRSKDWVALDPGEFLGLELEKKNARGEYTWVSKIKKAALILKEKGWQELYIREYGEQPIDEPLTVLAPRALANEKLFN